MSASPSRTTLLSVATSFTIVAVTLFFLVMGKDVFIPLVLGIFIAYLLVALSHVVERLRFRGSRLPAWSSLPLAIVLFILMLAGFVQLIAGNIQDAVEAAPQYQNRLEQVLSDINHVLASAFNRKDPLTFTTLVDQIDLRTLAGKFAAALQAIVGNTFEILIYVVFALLEYRSFDRKLSAMFPDGGRQRTIRHTMGEIGKRTETYVLIKTVMSLVIGGATYVTMAALGIDFAAFLGLLTFLANYIPYLGSAIGISLPALVGLLQTGSLPLFALIVGILVLIHILIGNVLEPRLMGRSLNLSPLLMIVALAGWGSIWGVAGMLLSVPIMVMLMIIFAQFPQTRPIAVFMSENGDVS